MNQIQSAVAPSHVNFQDILRALWRRLPVIACVMALTLGVTYYLSKKSPRRWLASAQLLLVERAPSFAPNQSPNAAPMVDTPETQVAMLQSRAMAQRAV